MTYLDIPPIDALSRFIKSFWILESEGFSEETTREKILPDGCMELIFHYADHFREYKKNQVETQPKSFIYGQITQFIEIGPSGKTGIIAVRFYPHGAEPFLRVPLNELTDRIVSVEELFGKEGRELEEKIMIAKNHRQRIEILQQFLINRLKDHRENDYVIEKCIEQIEKSKGQINVKTLSEGLNISARHLERKFARSIGMSPKMFARITRFQNIFKTIQQTPADNLTSLAYQCGYYDQAHFIKDFRKFSGINPRIYFNQIHQLSDFFTANS